MKLGLVAQIRNEIDIIQVWLSHVDALFDSVYLIDHQSIDGTGEILKQAVAQRPTWKYFFLDVKTKLQAGATTIVMHEALKQEFDYLFFLDADEFIEVKDRTEFEGLLKRSNTSETLGDLHWRSCIPLNLNLPLFDYDTNFWNPTEISNHKRCF